MFRITAASLVIAGCLLLATQHSFAQRAGQSATVRTGTVTAMRSVDLNDGNAVKGMLVGGAFGAALTRSSKSSGRRDRNAAHRRRAWRRLLRLRRRGRVASTP